MNNFKIGIIPYSWNFKNATVDWAQCEEEKHVAPGWENVDIKYRFNAQGFRTYDLERLYGQRVSIALGCSCTEGVGMPEDKIWSALVEKSLDHPVLNLGIQGGSGDTVVRILTNVCSLYDIQNVYILWPESSRFEIYNNDLNLKADPLVFFIHAQVAEIEHMGAMDTEMSIQRFYKNQSIVHTLAKLYNFKVSEHFYAIGREFQKLLNIPFSLYHPFSLYYLAAEDRARDGIHPGLILHENLAKIFLNQLTDK